MTEMDDGWVEVHDSTVWTRFETKPSPTERDRRVRVKLKRPNVSSTPLASPFFPVDRLPQEWRSCPTPLNDPVKLPSSNGGLSTDVS